MRETVDNVAAETFAWDIFLFGAQAVADSGFDNVNCQANVNLSNLCLLNDLSKPGGTALFVNTQHLGENTTAALFASGVFESNWPANGGGVAAYGAGGASGRPRSATIMVTKNDGGIIGL